jgi:hypothetical protein
VLGAHRARHYRTGVEVHERATDSVIDAAHEVELVDLSTPALQEGIERGDVYRRVRPCAEVTARTQDRAPRASTSQGVDRGRI